MVTIALLVLLALLGSTLLAADRARVEARRLRLLLELSGLLQTTTSRGEVAELVPVYGRHIFPSTDGAVRLLRGNTVYVAAAWGELDPDDVTGGTSVALMLGSEPIGELTVQSRGVAPRPAETALHAFADQIALALANIQRQDTLRTRAVRDALTGLFNRRFLEETLQHELKRRNVRTGVILVDVDFFKPFNDTYGHAGGDALLQQLARLMECVVDTTDVVCRYGGEEFIIVARDTTAAALRDCAERLREAVHGLAVDCGERVVGGITVSAGIALAPDHADTLDGLIGAADRALYAAKSAGRNRVATPPPHVVGRDAA